MITKQISDINITMSIKSLPLGDTKADVAIVTRGKDAEHTSMKLYYSADDIATDFGSDTALYAKAEAIFSQDDFKGPIAIISTKNVDSIDTPVATTLNKVTSTATSDGATVSVTTNKNVTSISPVVDALNNYLWSGWRYVLLDTDDDIEMINEVGAYLYENQHGILVASVSSIDNLKKINEVLTANLLTDHLGNTYVIVNKNEKEHPEAAAAAFASLHIPLDWMHIRNLNGVTANEWTYDEYEQIQLLNGSTTVNKAGDIMLSNSRAVDGTFVDNSFGAQYVYDGVQNGIQKFLNSQDLLAFDDDGINLLKATTEAVMANIGKVGIFANGLDGKPIYKVTSVGRSNISNQDVIARRYNGLHISCSLVNAIEKLSLGIDVTL